MKNYMNGITDKEIAKLAKEYHESQDYIRAVIKNGGKRADIVYLVQFLEEKRTTGVAPNEEPPAPLTKKDVKELAEGYGFYKGDVIRLARQEAGEGKEPTREHMESFLEEVVEDAERKYEAGL